MRFEMNDKEQFTIYHDNGKELSQQEMIKLTYEAAKAAGCYQNLKKHIEYDDKANKLYIFIDDERRPPAIANAANDARAWFTNYAEAVTLINAFANREHWCMYLDLDHDLGEDKTGYDICKYIVMNGIKNVKYHIHSMNPVGRENMSQLMKHYGYEEWHING